MPGAPPVERLPHVRVGRYLEAVGTAGHFARYVVAQHLQATSPGVVIDGSVAGVAVCGLEHGVYEAASCWIFASRPDVFRSLLNAAVAAGVRLFNVPLGHLDALAREHPRLHVSVDRLYVLREAKRRRPPASSSVVRLSKEALGALELPDAIAGLIGSLDALRDGFPLFGVVRDRRLVAVAETAVCDTTVGAIQQLFTLPAERRGGLAASLVEAAANDLIDRQLLPTYFVSEDNHPSMRLAEHVGFELESRWGCAEARDGHADR